MSQIKIETLTPVHIGNGNFLRNKADFTVFRDEKGHNLICVIDPRKILDLVGAEHLDDWILSIENQEDDIQRFVKQYNKNVTPDDYALRIIWNFVKGIRDSDTIKECMHDGRGMPYIPGSSIKGAIRTAIVSSLAKGKDSADLERRIKRGKNGQIDKRFAAQQIEKDFFGDDPKNDIFRFLQVGDAYFERGRKIAIRMVNLNITESENLIDKKKSQVIETIKEGYSSVFQMKIATEYYWKVKEQCALKDLPEGMKSISSLFDQINKCSKGLVLDEIDYWEQVARQYEGADGYIQNMRDILKKINDCKEGKECVLRIGHGSGWRFITGAWSEDFDNFYSKIVPVARFHDERYKDYDFPKSRRLQEKRKLIGFVKLSISEE